MKNKAQREKITFTFRKIILENMFNLLLLLLLLSLAVASCCAWPRDTALKMKDKRQQLPSEPGKLAYALAEPAAQSVPAFNYFIVILMLQMPSKTCRYCCKYFEGISNTTSLM